jgi:hypothetical protein
VTIALDPALRVLRRMVVEVDGWHSGTHAGSLPEPWQVSSPTSHVRIGKRHDARAPGHLPPVSCGGYFVEPASDNFAPSRRANCFLASASVINSVRRGHRFGEVVMHPQDTPTIPPAGAVMPRDVSASNKAQPALIVRARRQYEAVVVPHRRHSTFAETLAEIA